MRKNYEYFENLKCNPIEVIKVFGCSCSDIDFPYFEKIKECLPNAQWEFGWHDDNGNAAKSYVKRLEITPLKGKIVPNYELFNKT